MRNKAVVILIILLLMIFSFCLNPPEENKSNSLTNENVTSIVEELPEPTIIEEFIKPGDLLCDDCNVIIISLTNLRADHLSTYGYDRKTSPNIDRFAENSIVFENIFSHASWTLPVAISMFTSSYPFQHQIMDRTQTLGLDMGVTTIVELFEGAGYKTMAFTGDRDYKPGYGLMERFSSSLIFPMDHEEEARKDAWKAYGTLNNVAPPAIQWLKKAKDRKFFLLIQAYDMHCPFSLPEENDMFDPEYKGDMNFTECFWTFDRTEPIVVQKESYQESNKYYTLKTVPKEGKSFEVKLDESDINHMVALYDGEIYNSDLWVKKILDEIDELNLTDNTIIVFTSEHGDMFGKHGRFMRGGPLRGTFYDDVLHVPLIIYHPNLDPRRISGLGQIVDLAPTLLEFTNIPIPQEFQGNSLTPLMINNTPVNDYVFAGTVFTPQPNNVLFNHSSVITMIRDDDWKLIYEKIYYEDGPVDYFELYNLKEDPEELNNVVDSEENIAEVYKSKLFDWMWSFEFWSDYQ